MSPLISKKNATIVVTVQSRTDAKPDVCFDVIVPIDLSSAFKRTILLPGVERVENQNGRWEGVGETRNPIFTDGTSATETLTEFTRPHSFAYEITGFTNILNFFAQGIRGEWTMTPDFEGSLVRWSYEFLPKPGRALLFRLLVVPIWRTYMKSALERCLSAVADKSRLA